jgi:hypothetical protein
VSCVVSITTPPSAIPPAPATITYPAGSSTGQYTINWPSSSGATSYRLERSRNGGGWTRIYSGANNTYSERVSNGSYRYRVRASNSAGSSGWKTGVWKCKVSIQSDDEHNDSTNSEHRPRGSGSAESTRD